MPFTRSRRLLKRAATRWSKRAAAKPSRWLRFTKFGIEPLEDRLMLDGGLPSALVVGRTVSAYTTAEVQNNEVEITYTVYNQQATAVTGVLLKNALHSGVQINTASQLPQQSGQELAWSLGTIEGFERASVTMTVAISDLAQPIDTGARAFGTYNLRSVSDSTPAIVLRQGSVDPTLLAATIDANAADPIVQEVAAELDYDPQRVFDFLHDEISYQSYAGSTRGARGTLWSKSGNALDVASLGVALMRASGIPAEYVAGTLSVPHAQSLLLSMFDDEFRTAGHVPDDVAKSDPVNDPGLLAETQDHYWLRFDAGGGMQDADPLIAAAQVGQSFATAAEVFAEVPDSLREKTKVELIGESYLEGAAVLGVSDGLARRVLFERTFNDVELVGRPLTIGHVVSQSSSGFIFATTTTTYSPYIEFADDAYPDGSHDELLRGDDYQDVLTSLPLGSQVVTGLFVDFTLTGPNGPSQTYSRTLLDRIGYDVRQNGSSSNISVSPTGLPLTSPSQVWSVAIQAGRQDFSRVVARSNALLEIDQAIADPSTENVAEIAAAFSSVFGGQTRADLAALLTVSENVTADLASRARMVAYADRPRIIFVSADLTPEGTDAANLSYSIDLLRDSVRVIGFPGQSQEGLLAFRTMRGLLENVIEANHWANSDLDGLAVRGRISTVRVMEAALEQGIPLVTLSLSQLSLLDGLQISSVAKARITTALQAGKEVIVPQRSVTLDNLETVMWWELDPATGELTGVGEDGQHGAQLLLATVAAVIFLAAAHISYNVYIDARSFEHARLNTLFVSAFVDAYSKSRTGGTILSETQDRDWEAAKNIAMDKVGLVFAKDLEELSVLFEEMRQGYLQAYKDFQNQHQDPPLPDSLIGLEPTRVDPPEVYQEVSVKSGNIGGEVAGTTTASSLLVRGVITTSFDSFSLGTVPATTLSAESATVRDQHGNVVGSGAIGLNVGSTAPIEVTVRGTTHYDVSGTGRLTFYGPDASNLSAAGEWLDFSAAITGDVTLELADATPTLNGQPLSAGRYSVTTTTVTIAGNGQMSLPTFSGTASIEATDAAILLGAGGATLAVGASQLDVSRGARFAGYTGLINVLASADERDSVQFDGNVTDVLTINASPPTVTIDQNSSAAVQLNVTTSSEGLYSRGLQAPEGWSVTMDPTGLAQIFPPPGVQSGTYDLHLYVSSLTDPDLNATATVQVTIEPTIPGIELDVLADPVFTVPYQGANIPTAFRAEIQNLGPAADTFELSFSNIPAGFRILRSSDQVVIPAGETGVIGVYLEPDGSQALPAIGTPISFTVTATSTSDTAISQSDTVTLNMPEAHGLSFSAAPSSNSTTAGGTVEVVLSMQAVGNVAETVNLAAVLHEDLVISGLPTSVTIQRGESLDIPIQLTPDIDAELNSTVAATITAQFNPLDDVYNQTVVLQVVLRSAQVIATMLAADAATAVGNAELADTLSSIEEAIGQIEEHTNSAAHCALVEFLLNQLHTRLSAEESLAGFAAQLQPLQAAATACDVPELLALVPEFFNRLTESLEILATEQFTLHLSPGSVDLAPGQGHDFILELANTGDDTVSVDLTMAVLPGGVSVNFTETQLELDVAETVSIPLTLSQTLVSSELFQLSITAAATVARHTARATIAVRPSVADVLTLTATPNTVTAGDPIALEAQLFNTAQVDRDVLVHVEVLDSTGAIVDTLADQPVTLDAEADTITLDLEELDTAGLDDGVYRARVSLRTTDGMPLPGRSAEQFFLVGLLVTATVSASPNNLPPGSSDVETTISVTNLSDQFSLPGGKIVVNHDEWTLNDAGFSRAPIDTNQFVQNLTDYFGGPGSYLVYSDRVDFSGAQLATAMQNAGNTWTISTDERTLEELLAFDAVFVGGFAVDTQLLTDYVNAGGNVYLCAGFGIRGQFGTNAIEAAFWNPFLNNFDLELESGHNGVSGLFPVNSSHPLLAGVAGLYQDLGLDVQSLGVRGKVVELLSGHELLSVYEGQARESLPPEVPDVEIHEVIWTGGTSEFWNHASNWLDTTNNTSHVPTENDNVTIDAPGMTITVAFGTQKARSLYVAAGTTLAITGFTLSVDKESHIDGNLAVSAGIFNLGGDSSINGTTTWNGGTINVMGNTLINSGTITLGNVTGATQEILHSRDVANSVVPHGTLVNAGTIIHQGTGQLVLQDASAVLNLGSYQITDNNQIVSSSGPLLSPFNNLGTVTATQLGTTTLSTTLNNLGTVTARSGTLVFNAYVDNAGEMIADGGAMTLKTGSITTLVNGTFVARNGGIITMPDTIILSQADLIADGTGSQILGLHNLAINAGSLTVTNDADFSTSVAMTNRGTITVGPSSTLAITGRYTQESAGTLTVLLGGTPASGQFGLLTATQSATLDGLLRAEFVNGYIPTAGDSFTVVTSIGSSGGFDATILPATGAIGFSAAVNANNIMLSSIASAAAVTTTSLSSNFPGNASFKEQITFTASVSSANTVPTGSVQFQIDGMNSGAPVPLVNGTAHFSTTLVVGEHMIGAMYLSDSASLASSAANNLIQAVDPGVATSIGDIEVFFAISGTSGGVRQTTLGYDGAHLTFGPTTAVVAKEDADPLLYLDNGNLLVGGTTIRQINPSTGNVVGPVINTVGNKFALDPSGTKVWTSAHRNKLTELPLDPFGTAVVHELTGPDTRITQLTFDATGNAYYLNEFNFGRIDLSTFVTTRLLTVRSADQSLVFDPYTGDMLVAANESISQIDLDSMRLVSTRFVSAGLRHVDVDGQGHIFMTDTNGYVIVIDYSATGVVGDPRNFVGSQFLATELRDLAMVFGTTTTALEVTVDHDLPASGFTPDSDSLVPTGTVSPDNVLWNTQLPASSVLPATFQFSGQVTNMSPGEVRQISQGTSIRAVLLAPNGSALPVTLELPPVVVSADHIISISPTQSVDRNATATYLVTLENPLSTAVTYELGVEGLESAAVAVDRFVEVPAGQSVSVELSIRIPAGALPGTHLFLVTARTTAGGIDSVDGSLTITENVFVQDRGVNIELTPSQASAGQGTSAVYRLRITNLGNETDTYLVTGNFPVGVAATFSRTTIEVPAGLSNFREITLVLTPAAGNALGDLALEVSAISITSSDVTDTASGTLSILASGVSVTMNPTIGEPGDAFQLTVTNTGQIADTFTLALSGPGALVATLDTDEFTLAPGDSQVVSIDTTSVDFAVLGELNLVATATSASQPAVRDSATANLLIGPSRGLAAAFDPPAKSISLLGTTSFLLLVDNLGNVEDDFTATITGTTGPVGASLAGLDGEPAQVIPVFRLPGLSTGAILLNAKLLDYGEGKVMVQIRSQTNPELVSEVVARIAPRGCGTGVSDEWIDHPWSNPDLAFDVNQDGLITPVGDVLPGINALNRGGLLDNTGRLPVPLDRAATFCYDVNGDDFLTPVSDVLSIINHINRSGNPEGERLSANPSPQSTALVFPLLFPEVDFEFKDDEDPESTCDEHDPEIEWLSLPTFETPRPDAISPCLEGDFTDPESEELIDLLVNDIAWVRGLDQSP